MTAPVLASLRGRLVVSCQAYPGEPMRDPAIMTAVAQSVVAGGAAAIRAQGLADIAAMVQVLTVPLFGLVKSGTTGVFITPTVQDCIAVAEAGAHVVAVDGTDRPRPDGRHLRESVAAAHERGALVMADCGSVQDARFSLAAGVDCLGTTLAGYTGQRPLTEGPDHALLRELVELDALPVLAEGRVRTVQDALRCLELGAHCVVVGTAITHPSTLTHTFSSALAQAPTPWPAARSRTSPTPAP